QGRQGGDPGVPREAEARLPRPVSGTEARGPGGGHGDGAGRRRSGGNRARESAMATRWPIATLTVTLAWLLGLGLGTPAGAQEKPRHGGELVYSVLAEPPSFDAHQEATFAVPHSTAPFYSLLIRFDPNDYPKIVPDVAE